MGEINETMGWISEHRRILGTLAIGFAAFLLGLVVGIIVPSPFFHKIIIREVQKEIVLVDTVNMASTAVPSFRAPKPDKAMVC